MSGDSLSLTVGDTIGMCHLVGRVIESGNGPTKSDETVVLVTTGVGDRSSQMAGAAEASTMNPKTKRAANSMSFNVSP